MIFGFKDRGCHIIGGVCRIDPTNSDGHGGLIHMGVSKNRGGPPKWMVYNGKPYLNG